MPYCATCRLTTAANRFGYVLNEGFSHTPIHSPSTTAAKPAIRCRCGTAFPAEPLLRALSTALSLSPPSTTAAFPAIHCHCGTAFSAEPLLRALPTALPLSSPSTTAAFPAIHCRCGAIPLRVPLSWAHSPVPPSEGETISRISCSPSEGGPSLDFIGEWINLYYPIIQYFINQLAPSGCLKGRHGSEE